MHAPRLKLAPSAQSMETYEVLCRAGVHIDVDPKYLKGLSSDEPLKLRGGLNWSPEIPTETRLLWANNVIEVMTSESETPDCIRPWELLLLLDGSLESDPVLSPKGNHDLSYPAQSRIPQDTLSGLSREEKVKRAEYFALGTLLYEIETGLKPFGTARRDSGVSRTPLYELLSDEEEEEIQRNFSGGKFPDDVSQLKLGPLIYAGWSWEFLEEIKAINDLRQSQTPQACIAGSTPAYIEAYQPHLDLHASGVVLPPRSPGILHASEDFGLALEPGSQGAIWEATVQLGKIESTCFWLQDMTIGEAAADGLFPGATAGAGEAGHSTTGALLLAASELEEVFKRVYRKSGERAAPKLELELAPKL